MGYPMTQQSAEPTGSSDIPGINDKSLPLPSTADHVLTVAELPPGALAELVERFGLELAEVPLGEDIPGSFWGDREAGMIGRGLYVRPDTPVHSALHEFCHMICMDDARRAVLDTDAGGDTDEEDAVCYLQVLLAGILPGMGRERMFRDMDDWGYSFRLGSSARWFAEDAPEPRDWLLEHGLIDADERPTWRLRHGVDAAPSEAVTA